MLENNASKTSTFSNSEIRPLSQSEIELISGGKKSQGHGSGSFWSDIYHDISDFFGGGSDSGNSGIKNDGSVGIGGIGGIGGSGNYQNIGSGTLIDHPQYNNNHPNISINITPSPSPSPAPAAIPIPSPSLAPAHSIPVSSSVNGDSDGDNY